MLNANISVFIHRRITPCPSHNECLMQNPISICMALVTEQAESQLRKGQSDSTPGAPWVAVFPECSSPSWSTNGLIPVCFCTLFSSSFISRSYSSHSGTILMAAASLGSLVLGLLHCEGMDMVGQHTYLETRKSKKAPQKCDEIPGIV